MYTWNLPGCQAPEDPQIEELWKNRAAGSNVVSRNHGQSAVFSAFSTLSCPHFPHFCSVESPQTLVFSGVRGTFCIFRIFPILGFRSLISKIWLTGFVLTGLRWLGSNVGDARSMFDRRVSVSQTTHFSSFSWRSPVQKQTPIGVFCKACSYWWPAEKSHLLSLCTIPYRGRRLCKKPGIESESYPRLRHNLSRAMQRCFLEASRRRPSKGHPPISLEFHLNSLELYFTRISQRCPAYQLHFPANRWIWGPQIRHRDGPGNSGKKSRFL